MNKTPNYDALEALGVDIDGIIGGAPVQIEGRIGDKFMYFRARGNSWEFSIADAEEDIFSNPIYYREGDYGKRPFDASWMPLELALQMCCEFTKDYLR